MPEIVLPLTTYSINQNRASYPVGSPGVLALKTANGKTQQALMRVPIDRIPVGAVVTSAVVRLWTYEARSTSTAIRIFPINKEWKSSVTWSNRPPLGSVITTTSISAPPKNTMFSFDVTSWVGRRSRTGLAIDTPGSAVLKLYGSSAASNKPVLVVNYHTPNSQPVNLSPQGGAVSVPAPILTYTGDPDADHHQIQFSSDGTVGGIVFDTGSIPTSEGRYVPSGASPVLAVGQTTYWRVMTSGAGGISPWSPWVAYSYQPITPPVITSPPSETDDGSPPLVWTTDDQVSWQAEIRQGSQVLSKSTWDVDSEKRDWTPPTGIPIPGGTGLLVLRTTDSVSPRVAAEGAPVWSEVHRPFATIWVGDGPVVNNLTITFDDPIPTISGTRDLGVPDEIALVRDGVVVPIWDDDGVPHRWAPAADFFTGNNFSIPDYTADLRKKHTWSIRTRTNNVSSALGPTVSGTFLTSSVWIVDPRTGDKVEILGNNNTPVVSQSTSEGAVLHTPVHGNLVVEPIRRRLMRTTRAGGIEGLVLNNDENTFNRWALSDSGLRYRLIFGKVNWSVIFGDYSPSDVFYTHPDPECEDTLVLVSLNWWERLGD